MDLQLSGRRALVTGGTRGIGRAIVESLADEGAAVAFCARNADEVVSAEQAMTQRLGSSRSGRTVGSVVDVADAGALAGWVAESAGALGGIDIVVSNVSALAIPESEENWQRSFEIDLMGAVRLVTAALPHLEASDAAAVVAVSSVSGREIDFAAGPYGTMKAALVHYISGLAYQFAGKGIRANVVSPGNTFFTGGVWDQMQTGNPELYTTALGLNPTGRMGTPAEMARAVTFLVSPVSSFTSGTNLVVDGALTRGVQL
jgi:NAD(P)-dependent dehydrogenase (short-subunit alcohol dehydrogenase family)